MLKGLRALIHLGCMIPGFWLLYVVTSGDSSALGADPIKEIQHFLGFTAISILLIVFVLGIALFLLKRPQFQILRRPLGIWAWVYATLHIFSYFLLELGGEVRLFLHELVTRQYLIVGFLSFVILFLMTMSSLPFVKQRMGKYWRYLHKLGYLALLLGSVHYYLSLKNIDFSSILYIAIALFIVGWEMINMLQRRKL